MLAVLYARQARKTSERVAGCSQIAAPGGGTAMRGGLTAAFRAGASIECPLKANLVRSQIPPSPAVNRAPTLDQRLLQLLGPTVPAARAGRAFVALGIDPAAQAVARGEDRKG